MTTANCPTCGGPIEFKVGSSFLVVCPHCRSAIARTDRDLKDLGKVAALVDTDSPLTIGLQGKYKGVSFRLTGRAQLRHSMGGVWDEWYAAFSDNRWGWLAEAQGRYYLTFREDVPDLPDFDSLVVGEPVPKLKTPLIVAEKGEADYASADGEIPYALDPNDTVTYADLSGSNDLFATLDYSDGYDAPALYSGKEVSLNDLALNASGAELKKEKRAAITNLGCPNCGGSLELRAPDATERVGCPYCGSLLDCSQGKLSILQALSDKIEQPLIKLGSEAEFEGAKQIVIGFMKRSCVVDGTNYFWTEYLLYNKDRGFRWLVQSDYHWTFVRPLQAAQVRMTDKFAYYSGKSFKRWQDAPATVELVLGEFYWKVEIGETVSTSDFVNPPQMLSCERTHYGGHGGEIAWSLGEYVTPDEIQAKFKLPALVRPSVPGACEPNPHVGWFWKWCIGVGAVFVVTILLGMFKPDRDIVDQVIKFEGSVPSKTAPTERWATDKSTGTKYKELIPPAEIPLETPQVWVSEPAFELSGRQKVFMEVKTNLNNAWLGLECALIEEKEDKKAETDVLPFDLNVEYWSGVEDGDSWSEGDQTGYLYLPAQPPGKYVLRIEGHWEKMNTPQSFHLKVQQTTIDPVYLFLALLGVSIIPLIGLIGKWIFESRRWGESMYGSSSSEE